MPSKLLMWFLSPLRMQNDVLTQVFQCGLYSNALLGKCKLSDGEC